MKSVEVRINARFIVPDHWEVVDHVADPDHPEEVRQLLKVDGRYYDFFPECLVRVQEDDMVIWSADEGRTEEVIDCMEDFDVDIREDTSESS